MGVKPIKVCFISLRSFPVFFKKSAEYFGGAEVQVSLLAQALARDNNFRVSVIVGDYYQKPIIHQGRLILQRAFKQGRFFPFEVIRFFRLLKRNNADIYVERTRNIKVGLVALFCRLFKKKFVYMIAHDWDTQKDFGHSLNLFGRLSFAFGLKQADLLVAQTQTQQKQLFKNWRRTSLVLPSLIASPVPGSADQSKRDHVIWIGRADRWKRPEVFLKLVSLFPRQKFVMICRQTDNRDYFLKLFTALQPLPNLEFFTAVPFGRINIVFKTAKLLINTSVAEGFPNTFLQAGLHQVPILSLAVNPDRFLTRCRCGLVAGNNINRLVKDFQTVIGQRRLADSLGKNNRHYVVTHHHPKIINRLKQKLTLLGSAPNQISSPENR